MNDERGFSLVELLIVVAIIGILAAIATPLLRKAKNTADAGSAVATVRTLVTAERLYQIKFDLYGTLTDLVPEATLDTTVQSGTKSGYAFLITLSADKKSFNCTADPLVDDSDAAHYFVDETGVIRSKQGSPADATST